MANPDRFLFDPKDTWQRRRQQSAADRYGVKPPEPLPRQERVVAPPQYFSYSTTNTISLFYPVVNQPPSKFQPGDCVEVYPPHPEYEHFFKNYGSLVVERTYCGTVYFFNEACALMESGLRLKDGPW